MTISAEEAGAQLAAVEDVVARVKQSRIYRVSGAIIMLWGALEIPRYALFAFLPNVARHAWFAVDLVGVALTLIVLRPSATRPLSTALRFAAAFALVYGFGWIWAEALGHFGAREAQTFWPTLFLFCYCVAGLWFGVGFLVIGVALTGLILAGYLWAGPFYPLWLASVTSLGFIGCGLWMRRA